MENIAHETPSEADLAELAAWRHALHRRPELSGEEAETAQRVQEALAVTAPDQVIADLGGHGVAAVYDSGAPGPTVLFRCETDALPIEEKGDIPHRSEVPGKAHLCGHDGHSAIMLGFARMLGRMRPPRGRVVLLFQPAEENGAGARAVIEDSRFAAIQPDFAFSLHNWPGIAIGLAGLSAGPVNCASRGIRILLSGSTAHASEPEKGRSPMMAVSRLMPALDALGPGGALDERFALVTVTHASMGAPAYGVAPGDAEIRATLRTLTDAAMDGLTARAEALVAAEAEAGGLSFDIAYDDIFLACTNDAQATDLLAQGAARAGIEARPLPAPIRASEDFGRFGANAKSAMLFLGAGEDCPPVHTPFYDFPDALIAPGIRLFQETLAATLTEAP